MAAVHSPGPKGRQNESLSSLGLDSRGMTETCGAVCTSSPYGHVVAVDIGSKHESKVCSDDMAVFCDSKTEIGIVPQTNNAPAVSELVDLTTQEAQAQAYPVVACDGQRDFEWSEAEEESELHTVAKECYKSLVPEVRTGIFSEKTDRGVKESLPSVKEIPLPPPDRESEVKDVGEELQGEASIEGEGDGEMPVKERKSRLVCRECGKRFTRRETFNLHRHFHTHQDELASLTCKDCGLTFQHRSSLIKHRSEHKEKGGPVGSERRVHSREGRSLQCEYCNQTFLTLGKLRCHTCQRAPERPYRCPLCRREFQYRVSVNAHMQTHSLDSPFRCLECNKGFPCGLTLRIHQRSHAALKPFECPECGMVFRHRSVMEDHRRRHTEDRSHQCSLCNKRFKYISLLHQHQFLHTGQKPFRCPDCGKAFAFTQNMRAHWRQHRKRAYACSRCPLAFPDLADLQTHLLSHEVEEDPGSMGRFMVNSSEERSHSCPLCPLTLPDLTSLKAHILIHEVEEEFGGPGKGNVISSEGQEGGHPCPRCPLALPDLTSLRAHVLSHVAPLEEDAGVFGMVSETNTESASLAGWEDPLNRKTLKCPDCGKTFRHRSVLELHMRIHSRDKPFQCRVCGKGFKFSSYLQQHLIIHTGQKPFKCPDCGKDFAFLQNMKTHQRLHQQKPFRCTQCRKGYSEESELQRHMVSHTGDKPHKCQLCNKSFGLAYLLRDHQNTHTGERPHRCQECHKSFPWLSSLLVHQKIHARKRQGLNQPFSLPLVPQRGRGRGRGSRGRRGSRWASGWPRWVGGEGTSSQPSPYTGQISQGIEWHGKMVQQPTSLFAPHSDISDQWRPQQWQSEAQQSSVLPEQKQQQQPTLGWADGGSLAQVGQTTTQYEDSHSRRDSLAAWGFQTSLSTPQSLNKPEKPDEGQKQQQQQQQAVDWVSAPTSTQVSQTTVQCHESHLRRGEETHPKSVWDFKTRPSVVSQTPDPPEKSGDGQNQLQQPMGQTTVQSEESPAQKGEGPALWSFPTRSALPQTVSPTDKPVDERKPVAWTGPLPSTQGSQATAPHQESQAQPGDGTAIWTFQTPLTGLQTVSPPDKSATKTQSVVTDHPAPKKPTTPLLSSPLDLPPPQPLRLSEAPSPSQNGFLTQQAASSDKPSGQQTLPSLSAAQETEWQKADGGHPKPTLPFAPDPLLQCMICGCSLPRELDLHLHYMQHAQGEI